MLVNGGGVNVAVNVGEETRREIGVVNGFKNGDAASLASAPDGLDTVTLPAAHYRCLSPYRYRYLPLTLLVFTQRFTHEPPTILA